MVEKEGLDYGYNQFLSSVDTVILGRKTYDWVIKNAGKLSYLNHIVYVITSSQKESIEDVEFYNGSLEDLVVRLKLKEGKDIFCDGGSQIVNQLLKFGLIDEFVISVVPVLLGSGKRLFQDIIPTQNLKLISTQQFETGLVQLKYQRIN